MSSEAKRRMREVRTLLGTAGVAPPRPDKLARALAALHRWRLTPPAVFSVAALLYPDRAAIVDELASMTFAEVHRRTNALARSLGAAGVEVGDAVAIVRRATEVRFDRGWGEQDPQPS